MAHLFQQRQLFAVVVSAFDRQLFEGERTAFGIVDRAVPACFGQVAKHTQREFTRMQKIAEFAEWSVNKDTRVGGEIGVERRRILLNCLAHGRVVRLFTTAQGRNHINHRESKTDGSFL